MVICCSYSSSHIGEVQLTLTSLFQFPIPNSQFPIPNSQLSIDKLF
ncbi:MAG: hypothetical protein F6K31_23365 [Symploca sp. SIO2G7]|nr:hypothetical protein [Symploca sp. SIO2G7]